MATQSVAGNDSSTPASVNVRCCASRLPFGLALHRQGERHRSDSQEDHAQWSADTGQNNDGGQGIEDCARRNLKADEAGNHPFLAARQLRLGWVRIRYDHVARFSATQCISSRLRREYSVRHHGDSLRCVAGQVCRYQNLGGDSPTHVADRPSARDRRASPDGGQSLDRSGPKRSAPPPARRIYCTMRLTRR
jgi:hypothetical protein